MERRYLWLKTRPGSQEVYGPSLPFWHSTAHRNNGILHFGSGFATSEIDAIHEQPPVRDVRGGHRQHHEYPHHVAPNQVPQSTLRRIKSSIKSSINPFHAKTSRRRKKIQETVITIKINKIP